MKRISITYLQDQRTVVYAANELAKYISYLSCADEAVVGFKEGPHKGIGEADGIQIGLFSDFGLTAESENPGLDDEVYIDINGGKGIIVGSNYRSVLLGVYRFLTEAGIRWVRPGKDGEYIPGRDIKDISVKVREKAANRYRGICIEGAVSYENVAEIIEWAPKAGFNIYFIQFREAYTFFDRWYSHTFNETKIKEAFDMDKAREFTRNIRQEVELRGMMLHAVGHGWTCEPFGISGLGWQPVNVELPDEITKYLAEVNGKRELWYNVPLDTNLCYSKQEVRDLIVNEIVRYIENNPDVDVIHFWLADGSNNQCECKECTKLRPTDYYIKMLNDLDLRLTEKGLDTRIVFLLYVDLLWTPELEYIKNKDRFIMMFAPITRTYSESFPAAFDDTGIAEYNRNRLEFPSSVNHNLAYLKAWKQEFKGDSFDFDYHLMWDFFLDAGHMNISRVIWQDVRNLKALGMNGLVSCQVQRVFLPTGLAMYTMGKTLWNDMCSFEDIASDYYKASFGESWEQCKCYLENLSALYDVYFLKGIKTTDKGEIAATSQKVMEVIRNFRSTILNNCANENPCIARSWEILRYHAEIYYLLSLAIYENSSGNEEVSLQIRDAMIRYVQNNEDNFQSVLDVYEFINVIMKNSRVNVFKQS